MTVTTSVVQEIIKLDAVTAAALVSFFALFNGGGRPIFGWLTVPREPPSLGPRCDIYREALRRLTSEMQSIKAMQPHQLDGARPYSLFLPRLCYTKLVRAHPISLDSRVNPNTCQFQKTASLNRRRFQRQQKSGSPGEVIPEACWRATSKRRNAEFCREILRCAGSRPPYFTLL